MTFLYKGYDAEGKIIEGEIEVGTRVEAYRSLKERNIYVLELKEKDRTPFKRGFKLKDKYLYQISKELSVMLNAGINLDKALELLIHSLEDEKVRFIFERVLKDIKGGKQLSTAFVEHTGVSQMVETLIKVGEATGELKEAFENIAEYVNFRIKFRSEIINSLIYPAFLVVASLITIFGIFKFVIPKFFSIFAGNTQDLPFISKVIFLISQALDYRYIAIFVVVILILTVILKKMNIGLRGYILNILLDIPYLKKFFVNYELSKFYYSLHVMLKSGVEFLQSYELSKELITLKKLKEQFKDLSQDIKSGMMISDSFRKVRYLPYSAYGMIKVGEESGNLKDIFYELYLMSEEQVKNSIKKILVLIEPIIISVMGIVIGTIVVSLIFTVMSVSNIKL